MIIDLCFFTVNRGNKNFVTIDKGTLKMILYRIELADTNFGVR